MANPYRWWSRTRFLKNSQAEITPSMGIEEKKFGRASSYYRKLDKRAEKGPTGTRAEVELTAYNFVNWGKSSGGKKRAGGGSWGGRVRTGGEMVRPEKIG